MGCAGAAVGWGAGCLPRSRSPRLDAELLLAHALGSTRARVIARPELPLSAGQAIAYRDLVSARAGGTPVAYLRGTLEWFGMDLEVGPGVLVPRPETELLAEEAIRLTRELGARVVADIGTGSGAIAIALANALPGVRVLASDVSEQALAVARRNADRLVRGNLTLSLGDLLDPLTEQPDLIVANLPYLSREMMENLDQDVRQEPRLALLGGEDGLDVYRRLLGQMRAMKWQIPLVFEIDPTQSRAMLELLPAGSGEVELIPDYAGHDRIVKLTLHR